ncbi:MAG: hypothetical protein IPO88_33605 [Nannocystis sp.]|uniref:hypothetical protein n=1 Tax=Nannocystis sp. TaxID=1962667 RepID=UPI0024244F35|nr:hypothetical protein [Nannocystis sp.]MBK9758370.1 hypothetical protein [Nannocystis sp.]
MAPSSGERRSGQRRQLPRSRWQQRPSLLASAVLGVVVAVLLQSIAADAPPQAWAAGRRGPGAAAVGRAAAAAAVHRRRGGRAARRAQALTPAAVVLDERAGLRWRPLPGELTAAAVDPATPEPVRSDLHATCAALERLGL